VEDKRNLGGVADHFTATPRCALHWTPTGNRSRSSNPFRSLLSQGERQHGAVRPDPLQGRLAAKPCHWRIRAGGYSAVNSFFHFFGNPETSAASTGGAGLRCPCWKTFLRWSDRDCRGRARRPENRLSGARFQAISAMGTIKSENRNLAAMPWGSRRRSCFCSR